MHGEQVFVGRQPIVDREDRVVAYELLYRASAQASRAAFAEQDTASLRVIANTFMQMGVGPVLGSNKAFVNLTGPMLLSEIIEALPVDRVVIEILENVISNAEVHQRCRELREAGFRLALDDYVVDDPRADMLDLVDVVKVDFPAVEPRNLKALVRQLKRAGVEVLAEKVETQEEFELCHELGFDLFQGYYFAMPVVLEGVSIDPSRLVLMDLLQKLHGDLDTVKIVETLKRNTNLGITLLRLVNSAALARLMKISRIEDAVNYLGRDQLRRWVTILLFAGLEGGGVDNPLLQMAAHRGRLMELLGQEIMNDQVSDSYAERAFLAGMLSLLDVVLRRPIEEVLAEIHVEDEVRDAVLKREGPLGAMLELVEHIERADLDSMHRRGADLGIGLASLQRSDLHAYQWVHDLTTEAP